MQEVQVSGPAAEEQIRRAQEVSGATPHGVSYAALADGVTFALCLIAVACLYRLGRLFRGGALSGAFSYFIAAAAFFAAAFGTRTAADIVANGVPFGFEFRDLVVLVGLSLAVLGLRQVTRVWPKP